MDEKMEKMKQEIRELQEDLLEVCKSQQEIVQAVNILGNSMQECKMYSQIYLLYVITGNMKYEILDPRIKGEELFFPDLRSGEELVEKIVKERKSLVRFGDGEFSLMENNCRQKFQRMDNKLAERLREVIATEDESILIAIANNYGNLQAYNQKAADSIRRYMTEEVRSQHQKYLRKEKTYYDAYVTRPYVLMRDQSFEATRKRFSNIQRIWEQREVIVAEGALTRMGVGNDLLSNAGKVKRIIAPATNSFDQYDMILESCLRHGKKDTLFLIAMGPSAGVLAYDLTLNGYQAIDIGHLDLEYEWFLAGEGKRVPVKNKYNNELKNGGHVEEAPLPQEYFDQILECIEASK